MDDIEPFHKTRRCTATVLVLLGLFIALAIFLGNVELASPRIYTVNDPSDANTTWKTEKPLTYEEAKAHGHCPIPLPAQARNIQFVNFYAGFRDSSVYARLEAPVEVCRSLARQVITEYNAREKEESRKLPMQARPWSGIGSPDLAERAKNGHPDSQAPWFDCEKIRQGEIWGENDSHRPVMLIDLNRGVFYYHISD